MEKRQKKPQEIGHELSITVEVVFTNVPNVRLLSKFLPLETLDEIYIKPLFVLILIIVTLFNTFHLI